MQIDSVSSLRGNLYKIKNNCILSSQLFLHFNEVITTNKMFQIKVFTLLVFLVAKSWLTVKGTSSYTLEVQKADENLFMATVNIHDTLKTNSTYLETVIILDVSGSMGNAVERMANEIIPMFLSKLLY